MIDAVLIKRLLTKSPERIMRVEGLEIGQKALKRGKGVVFLTAHMGCFEMLSPRFSQLGFPTMVVGTSIYDPRIDALVAENRAHFNVEYIPREGDLRSIIRGLRHGKAFGVLCDLDTRVESLFIPFFGRPAKTPVAPFKLALRTGAAMIPIFAQRQPDGAQQVTLYPPIEPLAQDNEAGLIEVMTTYNRILEDLIRRDPAQWIWMHNRWKSQPEATIPVAA
jgi:KDO2-lipid IV(A) lauroyltransferase